MPLTRSHIRTTAEKYLARHPHERESLAGLLSVLDGADNPAGRATLPGHVTCSAAVIDREQRVLHIGHMATGLLLDPGGHVEDDRTLLAAELREVCEETGLRPGDLCLTPQFLGAPIDIAVHDIDANPAKGEGAHQHFDFRFAFYLVPEEHPQLTLQDEEVTDAQWLEFADVRSPTLRAKLLDVRDQGLDGRPEPVNASALIHDGHGRYLLHLRDQREGIWAPGTFALLGGGPGLTGPDAAVVEFAERAVGRITGWTDTSWARENSRVWRAHGAQGAAWYVKVHQSERFHGREVRGLRMWAPALGAAAPRLVAADETLRAVVITAVPGRPLHGVVPSSVPP
ncbi:NUDIX domain-containing protein [Streptomyces sp. NPDC014724]|uniref:NUDIX hydrolase n=1 Tax=unclassified Streptomyces TaxID=2593676 RepID=UPI0036F60695